MRDVARRAGVSVKTVSNVVNQFPHVSAVTRERVLGAIEELGYQMNFSARSLSLGRTGMITLAVPELSLPYFAELADEVIDAAGERGYTVLVEQTGGQRERELEILTSARRRMTDGLVLSPLGLREGDVAPLGYPLVLLGERSLGGGVPHVAMANRAGGRAVGEHLLTSGRRRIGVIGTHDVAAPGAGSMRAAGFRDALADAGLPEAWQVVSRTAVWTRASGAAAMAELLERHADVDAVFGLNDVLALGAMRVLFERGIRVPDDVAVAGFDDIDESRYSRPSLTTISAGRSEIARTAVSLLTHQLLGGPEGGPLEVVADHALVVRESTAPAAG